MQAEIGIIGGTGFYRFFDDSDEIEVDTPYGRPSSPISLITIDGKSVAFLPRHGRSHEFLPASVPYKANLYAMRSLGVTQVIGFNTVGSLQREIRKGHFVFCDQFVDRTAGRQDTIFDGPQKAHISTAEPYCARMRAHALEAVKGHDEVFHASGTIVVIQGPRFSTKAESRWFSRMGWDVVNMTQYPEVAIARELGICYMNLSYVTDYDVAAQEITAGIDAEPVSHAMVINEFSLSETRIREIVLTLIAALPGREDCECHNSLANARVGQS